MSPNDLKIAAERIKKLLNHDAPRIAGIEGTRHFKASFQNEGFTDEHLEPWQDITPARKKQKARRSGTLPPILTDQGHLGDSIDWDADYESATVTFSTDKPYAQVHNEGGGPKRMPKRQFMGPSKALNKKIIAKLERELDKILKPS